jgi:selenocysteine lyase/cysteine desulfurase
MDYPTTNVVFLGQIKYGAEVVTIKNNNYKINISDYVKKLDNKTLLVGTFHVSSLNGFMQNIKELNDIVQRSGAYLYIDAYQSLGTIEVDVRKIGLDFLASGTLKWLLGLPGVAYLYIREDHIENINPAFIGWLSQEDPFLFGPNKLNYRKDANKIQLGTWSIPAIYASIEGIKFIRKIGLSTIRENIVKLTKFAIEYGTNLGLKTITPLEDDKRGGIVAFIVKNPHKVEVLLKKDNIITSARGNSIRLCPHFYNTKEDLEIAIEKISKILEIL